MYYRIIAIALLAIILSAAGLHGQPASREDVIPGLEPLRLIGQPRFGLGQWGPATVALSPDGSQLLEYGIDGLHLWNSTRGTLIQNVDLPRGWFAPRAAFLTDRHILIAHNDQRKLARFDLREQSMGPPIEMPMKHVRNVQAAPAKDIMLIEGAQVQLWRISTMKPIATLREDNGEPWGPPRTRNDLAAGGSLVLIGDQRSHEITLYDAATGKPTGFRKAFPTRHGLNCKLSADGSILAVWDRKLRFFNTHTGEELGQVELRLPDNAFYAFDRTSHRIAAIQGRDLWLIDSAAQQVVMHRGAADTWGAVMWGPRDQILMAAPSTGGLTWLSVPDLEAPMDEPIFRPAPAHVQLSPDGQTLFSSSYDGRIERWNWDAPDRPTAEFRFPPPPGHARLETLILSTDGTELLAVMGSGECIALRPEDLTERRSFQISHTLNMRASADLSMLVGRDGSEETLTLFDGESGRSLRTIKPPINSAHNFELTPDGKYLLVGDSHHLLIYETATGRLLANQPQPATHLITLQTDPLRVLVLDHNMRAAHTVMNPARAQILLRRHKAGEPPHTADPLAALLAARAADPQWGKHEPTRPEMAVLAPGSVPRPQFTPNFDGVDIYVAEHWAPALRLTGQIGTLTSMASSRDGRRIAVAGSDGTIALYDLAAQLEPLQPLPAADERLAEWIETCKVTDVLGCAAALSRQPERLARLERRVLDQTRAAEAVLADLEALRAGDVAGREAAHKRLEAGDEFRRLLIAAALLSQPAGEYAQRLRALAAVHGLPTETPALQKLLSNSTFPYLRNRAILALARHWK